MTVQATPPSLIAGLRPVDRSFESWWVRPGSATAVELHAGDRVTIRRPGRRPARRGHGRRPDGRDDSGALGLQSDAPATVLRGCRSGRRRLPRRAARARPAPARREGARGSSAPTAAPGASETFDVRARRAARGRRSGRPPDRRRPAGLGARHRDQAPRPAQAGRRPAAASRSPSRGSTSASTARARSPTRCARASSSR